MEQVIDEKKLIDFIDAGKFRNPDELHFSENDVVRLIKNFAELSNELKLSEQPKADWIPYEVKDIIDTIISHNEIVALWIEEETEDVRYDKQIWRGMAWDIPNSYKGCKFIKIFGTVPESIVEADTINIRIETPQSYKKEGADDERS